MANKKNTVMIGRSFAKPSLRKFNGGEIVKTRNSKGLGKKWIVENDLHSSDSEWTKSAKHSYYRCRRGRWVKYFRSDNLFKVRAKARA
jgi:hypothetical protein